jgi:hypothetical protein
MIREMLPRFGAAAGIQKLNHCFEERSMEFGK